MQIWFVTVIPKHLNFATFSKDLLAISKLLFCPAVWWQDITIYLVFSVHTLDQPSFQPVTELLCFYLWCSCFFPSIVTQHRPGADVSHSVSILHETWFVLHTDERIFNSTSKCRSNFKCTVYQSSLICFHQLVRYPWASWTV